MTEASGTAMIYGEIRIIEDEYGTDTYTFSG